MSCEVTGLGTVCISIGALLQVPGMYGENSSTSAAIHMPVLT